MPIQVLPQQLINQIAAGEVVKRPASIVKELVENSIDAGATYIEIYIEHGGAKRIRIRDNGRGIHKNELMLALTRHATSKITSLEDFEYITSMGFRGEALASVSSVSRLMLTSRTATQNEAWQAYTDGYDLAIVLKPTAHPVGTTVDVMDLFYNVPARRKFMRTEKTEFIQIDEVVRRIALARFDVTFILQHNGKIVRKYRAVEQQSQQHLSRLRSLCGHEFVECALAVSWQQKDLALRGWIAAPTCIELTKMQYHYVNLRMIRNKLMQNAIRQAYQDQITGKHQPVFVLFLDINPNNVDINVHPTKYEVRFYQAPIIYDFIYRAICTVLQQSTSLKLPLEVDNLIGHTHKAKKLNKISNQKISNQKKVDDMPRYYSGSTNNIEHHNLWCACASERNYQPLLDKQLLKHDILAQRQLAEFDAHLSTYLPKKVGSEHNNSLGSEYITVATTAITPTIVVNKHSFGQVLTLVSPYYVLLQSGKNLTMLSLPVAEHYLLARQLTPDSAPLRSQPLLIPLHITLCDEEAAVLMHYQQLLQEMGITLQGSLKEVTINAVPLPLRQQNLQQLIPDLLVYLHSKAKVTHKVTHHELASWLACQLQRDPLVWSHSQAIQLLAEVERLCPQLITNPPSKLLVILNLESAIKALNHD